jgi:DNA-binding PadR family transcriptional regulator
MGMGRAPRGNVRAAILLLLSEQPRNGYQMMQEIGERSNGVWHPSPGSVYPALQQLEDEALVRVQEVQGQRAYALTDAGEAYLQEHRAEFGLPWDEASGAVGRDVHELVSLMRQSAGALFQVVRAGDSAQVAKAAQLMRETRRSLYRILAEEEATGGGQSS